MKYKGKRDNDDASKPKKIKKYKYSASDSNFNDTDVNNGKANKSTIMEKEAEGEEQFQKLLDEEIDKLNIKDSHSKGDKDTSIKKVKLNARSNSVSTEKLSHSEFRKKQKELKEKRKAKKLMNVYDICVRAKQISEKLRRSDCKSQQREALILEVHELLQTHYGRIVFTHDMSRIIQWLLKFSDSKIQQAILEELKPFFIQIVQSKYAKNCIKVLIKSGSEKTKHDIISLCYGNIVKLMSHSVSAPLVELLYSTCLTDLQKVYFKQEFYSDMYKNTKDINVQVLSDVFKTAVEMKQATLSAVKGNLLRILNKNLINSTLVQMVLWEFLTNCTAVDRTELIVSLRESVVDLARSKIGAKIAVTCIWHGTNKDRKVIIKSLKGNVKTICMSEHAYIILLALIDTVDDMVPMRKIILSEIQDSYTELALNEYGKHVILYLIARRDSHYFPPNVVEYLSQGDNNATSKKPANIRETDFLESVRDTLIDSVAKDTAIWFANGSISMITLAILKIGLGEKLKCAFESVAAFIIDTKLQINEGEVKFHVIEHPGLHMAIKKLIQNDRNVQKRGETPFGEILINKLTVEILREWIQFNRACFVLITLIENETEPVINTLLLKLKPLLKSLKNISTCGASILLKKLK